VQDAGEPVEESGPVAVGEVAPVGPVAVAVGVFVDAVDSAAEFVSGGEGEVEALEVAGSFWS
jgi:hypothetical protein